MSTTADPDWKVLLTDLFAAVGNLFFDAWIVMLLLGTLHGYDRSIPGFGYWPSFFIAWVLSAIVSSGNYSVLQRVKKLTPGYGKKDNPASELAKFLASRAKTN